MLEKLHSLEHLIGNTQVVPLEHDQVNLFTKLEYQNLTGSVKVRPAYYILESAIKRGEIDEHSTVIESSSGNFAVALGTLCKRLGLTFIPVIDPNINSIYENVLLSLTDQVEKVYDRDETNGFLLTRLQRVQDLLKTTPGSFWTNQYGNPDAVNGHYYGLGEEIGRDFEELDYVFLGVSSCGTIAGVSKRLKEKFPNIKVVAVDSQGSVIFGDTPRKRFIPGIGSSLVPTNLQEAQIDDVLHVPEVEAIDGCYEMLNKHSLFVGGSSGSVYAAIRRYFQNKTFAKKPNVLFICADNGTPYVNTVYNREWVNKLEGIS
ncbi:MAG TPA: 2,3-diaminopropionate biosynthesis protein SbnA [Bacilli bacterium]|nr:2,3-diaminopropionate biosynthesis protein SbnA [Bacilli bacterium]